MEFPATIESQGAFDEIVKERIGRIKAQYADYDDLKSNLAQAEAAKAKAEEERDSALAVAGEATGKLAAADHEAQVAAWRTEVASTNGLPAEALAGATREEFEAHAAILKPLMTPQPPVIPTQGQEPEAHGGSDERAFVRSLFGGDE